MEVPHSLWIHIPSEKVIGDYLCRRRRVGSLEFPAIERRLLCLGHRKLLTREDMGERGAMLKATQIYLEQQKHRPSGSRSVGSVFSADVGLVDVGE